MRFIVYLTVIVDLQTYIKNGFYDKSMKPVYSIGFILKRKFDFFCTLVTSHFKTLENSDLFFFLVV